LACVRCTDTIALVRTPERTPLTYRDAGVDIDRGNALVGRIRSSASRTRRDGQLTGIGGFGALFEVPTDRYRHPVMVSGTDGVGTKLKLAIDLKRHRGVGIDLVAMCVNDILTLGAEPLFFLDYYATAKLDSDVAGEVVEGIADGCVQAGAALIGGETAEMPGMYAPGDYDVAGFCVGVVERERIIDGNSVTAGDVVLGLASSGAHSNGFSLIRRIIEREAVPLETRLDDGKRLADALLEPTRIYVKSLLDILREDDCPIHALSHITGGGLSENIPRVLPASCAAHIDASAWPRSALFQWIESMGAVPTNEMLRTFNCGIGMAVICRADAATSLTSRFELLGEQVFSIGEIRERGPATEAGIVIE
jgi:phosphoribosylformylglycinamidine cyclo-ligase